MNIPTEFRTLLEKNQKLDGIVKYTISQYENILKENNLYFFEEYTDHGINHIESVLSSTLKIIPNSTIQNFLKEETQSVAIYILSTILHDIGMHITPEGFFSLISGSNDDIRINEIDSKTWRELWNDYLDEARRFGDKEKKNIIGNIDWKFKTPQIDNKDKLNGEDRKFIGEFIRRHHPRIAHEIALKGFPIKEGHISFASDLEYELRNICGLVARSHGVNIRSLFEYLESKFQDTWLKPYNIEIIYLMVLLRIADYFQIDSSRTPDITVKLKSFNSPISQIEHYKHLDVKYVQPYNKDPETLILQCEPRNSLIYIKLIELFRDIQKELDTSWAILGEAYGKETIEKQPKIAFRRIKSNIDNLENFSKKVDYIPEKISFNVSKELPKLLIGPLYGNDPTYGVRELLQNAVDSCREREYLEKNEYKGKVKITIYSESDNFFFKIEDNGLGMSLNIIKHYFLEVGASLRKSTLWKKAFSDDKGETKIQRSGKFGIGVLASFLIGDTLTLETKDSNSSYGLYLTTDLNNEQIEIKKTKQEKVGTIITIQIKKEILNQLKNSRFPFDKWYVQNNPNVEIQDLTKSFSKLGVKEKSPGMNDTLCEKWNELKIEGYNKIIWTYSPPFFEKYKERLISNGIVVPEFKSFKEGWREIEMPFISVFDFNGNLPLNLSRNNLDEGILPFEKELQIEIYKDLIAKLLCEKYEFDKISEKIVTYNFYHPSIEHFGILFSKDGFILEDIFFIKNNANHSLLELHPNSNFKTLSTLDIKDSFIYIGGEDKDYSMTDYQYRANIRDYNCGAKLFITNEMYKKLFDNKFNRYPIRVRRDHEKLNSNESHTEIRYNFSESVFSLNELNKNLRNCNCIIESKVKSIEKGTNRKSVKLLHDLFEKYIGKDCVIPYDIVKRKEKFKLAFTDLEIYIKKYIA